MSGLVEAWPGDLWVSKACTKEGREMRAYGLGFGQNENEDDDKRESKERKRICEGRSGLGLSQSKKKMEFVALQVSRHERGKRHTGYFHGKGNRSVRKRAKLGEVASEGGVCTT